MLFSKKLVKDYPYESAPLKRLVPIRHFEGLEHSFGGNLYPYVAETKNGLHLVLTKDLKTIAVFLDENNLIPVDGNILREVARENKIEFDWRKTPKNELIELIRAEQAF
jgi:hypothetical protein